MKLSAQAMEVIGRSGAVDDLPVAFLNLLTFVVRKFGDEMRIFVDLLQKPFDAATGMLGALSVITMRQKHDKSGLTEPLVFTSREELINNDLSAIDKVTELGFPQDETNWVFLISDKSFER